MDGGSWVVLGTSTMSCRLAADCREQQAYTRRIRRLGSMLRSWRLAVEAVEAVGGNRDVVDDRAGPEHRRLERRKRVGP